MKFDHMRLGVITISFKGGSSEAVGLTKNPLKIISLIVHQCADQLKYQSYYGAAIATFILDI